MKMITMVLPQHAFAHDLRRKHQNQKEVIVIPSNLPEGSSYSRCTTSNQIASVKGVGVAGMPVEATALNRLDGNAHQGQARPCMEACSSFPAKEGPVPVMFGHREHR
jgi:hypothetical protein